MPKKGKFRQRAHSNPFADHDLQYPLNPAAVDWPRLYPQAGERRVQILDIGCGYGGLLVALAPLFPDSLILGLEIRQKVVNYVSQRIAALRASASIMGAFENIAVERANSMKYLVNYIAKGQIDKAFILFPDPHFKQRKHKARIVTSNLLAEYAFLIKPGGRLYIATDVPELFRWMTACVDKFPLFRRLADPAADPCVDLMINRTEESFKVVREGRDKHFAVYERIDN